MDVLGEPSVSLPCRECGGTRAGRTRAAGLRAGRLAFLLLLLWPIVGCASLHTRFEPMAPDYVVYPGLTAFFAGGDGDGDGGGRTGASVTRARRDELWFALCMVDIPFSLALDTVLLPVDLAVEWVSR